MRRRLPPNLGLKVLAVWLIIYGLTALVQLQFEGLNLVLGALAIVAGVLIIIER